ncbi:MAG TPA: cadherin-like beta sandwich domain-containing protein, partial [Spirochaetota bacterium]|nr:cadherin-like beta sandwich domain-containing protein [Spirochaetota bacterium]
TSKTYTRLSDNPKLESIYISNGGLRPAFSPDITEYELDLSVSVTKIKVAVKSEEINASIKITAKYDGTNETTKELVYDTPTEDISILNDNDRLSIKVTAPSGLAEKTYKFNIKKKNVTSNPLLLLSSEYDLSNDSMILFIGSVTDGAKIRVTYDGSTPTRTNGSDFPNGGYVILNNSYTIKAFAYFDGMEDSPISELNFDITKYKPYIIDVMVNNESIPFNFNKKAEGYFWEVNSSLESCAIKAICENPKSTMSIKTKFNGTDEVLQSLSHNINSNPITLNPEQNWIEITVTSENKEVTKTYYFVMRKKINSVANPIINPKNSSFVGNIGVLLESPTPDSTIIY